jgi:hypothetical protein
MALRAGAKSNYVGIPIRVTIKRSVRSSLQMATIFGIRIRILGRGLNRSQPNSQRSELDEGEERSAELVVAGCDAPDLLQLVEEALDEVVFAVDGLGPTELPLAVGPVGNDWNGALSPDVRANPPAS